MLVMADPNSWHTMEEGVPDAKEYKSSEYPIAAVPSTIVSKGDSTMGRVLTTEGYCTRTLAWVALRKAAAERVLAVSMHPSAAGESMDSRRRAALAT